MCLANDERAGSVVVVVVVVVVVGGGGDVQRAIRRHNTDHGDGDADDYATEMCDTLRSS